MGEDLWEEIDEGEIHERDTLQFEFKCDFLLHSPKNTYTQEFYIFIPEALQINSYTYSKQQFYLDQTNIIRYKTPRLSFQEMTDVFNPYSPLTKLKTCLQSYDATTKTAEIVDEIKLFGNIFRVALRNRVREIVYLISGSSSQEAHKTITDAIAALSLEVNETMQYYRQLQTLADETVQTEEVYQAFRYVDEFISQRISHYLLTLDEVISYKNFHHYEESKKILSQTVIKEIFYRKTRGLETPSKEEGDKKESILYRQSLLNKYVLEALSLKSYRFSIIEKHASLLGALAAGLAMFVYLVLFAWKVSTFVVNSLPVILMIVFLYILKDRIKEWVKQRSFDYVSKWFPDYSTEIRTQQGFKIGKIDENIAFISQEQLPDEIRKIRFYAFNEELSTIPRHETIVRYRRSISVFQNKNTQRRRELTTFFRLNIRRFIEKANNPIQPHFAIDPYSHEVKKEWLPKIYHLNIIVKTVDQSFKEINQHIKKFRIIVDKNGIERVVEID